LPSLPAELRRRTREHKVTIPSKEDEAALEATKAPLMEHLLELRKRLIFCLIAFAVCFVISFYFSRNILDFLTVPLHQALKGQSNDHMIYTALYEVFFTEVKIGMFGGLCLGFPVIAAQIWMFIAPGLYKHEKRAFLPFLMWTPVLFIMGAAFVYYIMLPTAIRFFASYQITPGGDAMAIQLQAKVSDYLDLVMTLMFGFGLTFQLPVVLSLLGKVGIVSSKGLKDMRRFAYVGLFGVAAVFTPPDAFSMLCLAFPLVALYEISILSVMMIERDRAKEDAARNTDIAPT
jgi:sec-independent protein translocase protein TatC